MTRNLFIIFVVLSAIICVDTFHLQSDPNEVARVCHTWNRNICSSVGLTCRGNQNFDADAVHAVCDLSSRRTCGIRRRPFVTGEPHRRPSFTSTSNAEPVCTDCSNCKFEDHTQSFESKPITFPVSRQQSKFEPTSPC